MPYITPELHHICDASDPMCCIRTAAQIHRLTDYIHLRGPGLPARELAALAEALLEAGVPTPKLIMNDRVDIALALGLGGVQLAWHSLEPRLVKSRWPGLRAGRSVHSPEEAEEAFRQGADFVLFGHVYETGSKPGVAPRGLEALAETVRRSNGPVIALGGITPERVGAVLAAGAAGYAVLSGIGASPEPLAAVARYRAGEALIPIPDEGGESHEALD